MNTGTCSPADEIRRVLIIFRRKLLQLKQQSPSCAECVDLMLRLVVELETRLEEYEYEEAIGRWG